MNRNRIILKVINSSYTSEQITELLGLDPTSIKLKGEQSKQGLLTKQNVWEYERKSETSDFIGDLVDEFITDIIIPRINYLAEVAQNTPSQLTIVQYYYDGSNPGHYFKPHTLKIIGEACLALDIDTYCLTDASASR